MEFSIPVRRAGILSAFAIVVVQCAYLATLLYGLLTLPSPDAPISDPAFTILELLILLLMPLLLLLMAVLCAWAPPEHRTFALSALVFMAITAALTSTVHACVLVLSRTPPFSALPEVFAFRWPSVVYVLDILAWDVFFALAALAAAPVFRGSALARRIRLLLIISGVLALAGLGGVAANSMAVRNVGILGYAVVFPVAVLMMALLFQRAPTRAR